MADGRPIDAYAFAQNDEEVAEEAVAQLEQAPPSDPEDRKETRLHNSLLAEGNWAENPHIADQENRFPDTVRTHAVTFKMFNVTDQKDMAEYSKIYLSDIKRGRYVFASHEQILQDLPNARCFVLVRVEERRFLSLTTATSNPNED